MNRILFAVLFLGFILRVFLLSSLPIGFTPDEASFGYDAYSILRTGKDQWGHPFPLVLESFGDFKAPLYAYLSIPFVWIFGLTKLAVRLPNAIVGVAAIYATYLLTKKLLKSGSLGKLLPLGKNKLPRVLTRGILSTNLDSRPARNDNVCVSGGSSTAPKSWYSHEVFNKNGLIVSREFWAVFSGFLLATSPWHIMMSRGAFEANLTTFFLPMGIYLFLSGIGSKNLKTLLYSAIFFGINMFTYHSAKLVTPLIILFLTSAYFSDLRKIGTKKLLPAALVMFLFLVLSLISFNQGGGRRISDVSITGGALEAQAGERLEAINSGVSPFFAKLLHNKYQVMADRLTNNLRNYWSFEFLFTKGAREATYGMVPGIGTLRMLEGLFMLGFVVILASNTGERGLWLVFTWLAIGFIPASLTTGVGGAANRAEIILPSVQIACTIGVAGFISILEYGVFHRLKNVIAMILLLVFFVESLVLFNAYRILSPTNLAKGMLFGNLEAAQWLVLNSADKKYVVSTSLSEPHIYIAFAKKWNPRDYQKQSGDWKIYKDMGLTFLDQMPQYSLGNFVFEKFNFVKYKNGDETMLVGRPEDFPKGVLVTKTFYYPDGSPAILVVDSKQEQYASTN